MTLTQDHDDDFGSEYTWERAKVEEAGEIAVFVVGCLRSAFTMELKLGPQEVLKSDAFAQAYEVYRHNSITNPENICRVLRRRDQEDEGIVAYAELGHRKEYKGTEHIDFEIICLFVEPTLKGKGIGTLMLSSLFNEMAELGRLKIGQSTVGVMTMYQSPFIRFYRKIGGKKESHHEVMWVSAFYRYCSLLLVTLRTVRSEEI